MSDTKDTNPKDAAATTRLDLSLFPPSAVAYGALAFTEGDLKYGGYNWRTAGIQVTVYIAALLRHIFKYVSGEWADPKTNVPHLASALACIAALIDGHEMGNLNDDRPPQQDMAGLLDRMEGAVAHLQKIFPRRHARHRAVPQMSDIVLKQEPVRPFAGVLETTADVSKNPERRKIVAEVVDTPMQRWDRPPSDERACVLCGRTDRDRREGVCDVCAFSEEPGDDRGNQCSFDEMAARRALRGPGGV